MKSQVFEEEVSGQVVMGDVVNQIHHDASRALTTQERIELNNRVKQLTEQSSDPGWKTWRFLHRTIGIDSVEAMRLDQRDSAHAIIDLLLDRARLQANVNQQQSHDEDAAGQAAGLLVQNGELSARLKEAQAIRRTLEKSISASQDNAKEALSTQEKWKFAAGKNENMLAVLSKRYQALESELSQASKRGNWLLAMVSFFVVTTAIGLAAAYYQTRKALAAEARLSICAFDGKAYEVGSVIDGTPDHECVRTNDGRTAWKVVSEKSRRTK